MVLAGRQRLVVYINDAHEEIIYATAYTDEQMMNAVMTCAARYPGGQPQAEDAHTFWQWSS